MATTTQSPQPNDLLSQSQPGPSSGPDRSYWCSLTIGKYKRPVPFSPTEWNPHSIFNLPLPLELADVTASQYSTTDMGAIGDLVNGNIGTGALSAALRNSGRLITEAATSFSAVQQAFQRPYWRVGQSAPSWAQNFLPSASQMVAGELRPDQITTAFEQYFGATSNPNLAVKYIGPVLRDFSLTWSFSPKSAQKAQKLKEFISIVKGASLPSPVFNDSAALLRYPDMAQLNFYPWDAGSSNVSEWGWGENSIIKYKKCMIGSVNVFYNPSNVPAFGRGTDYPVAVQVSISFKEIEYLFATDWDTNGRTTGGITPGDIGEVRTPFDVTTFVSTDPGLALAAQALVSTSRNTARPAPNVPLTTTTDVLGAQ